MPTKRMIQLLSYFNISTRLAQNDRLCIFSFEVFALIMISIPFDEL